MGLLKGCLMGCGLREKLQVQLLKGLVQTGPGPAGNSSEAG